MIDSVNRNTNNRIRRFEMSDINMVVIGNGSNMNVVGMAKVFNGGKRIAYCLDTPNSIRIAFSAIVNPDYPFVKNCFGEVISPSDVS